MECYFWNVGMIFEPKFSDCRKSLTKLAAIVTTIDDVYDVYGSLDELELFTAAVHRFAKNSLRCTTFRDVGIEYKYFSNVHRGRGFPLIGPLIFDRHVCLFNFLVLTFQSFGNCCVTDGI